MTTTTTKVRIHWLGYEEFDLAGLEKLASGLRLSIAECQRRRQRVTQWSKLADVESWIDYLKSLEG